MLSTPVARHQHLVVPPSASTITSQTSLRPTPKSYVTPTTGGTAYTPATSVFTSPSEDTHTGVEKAQQQQEKEEGSKASHRQSLPWGKAILSAPIQDRKNTYTGTDEPTPSSATLPSQPQPTGTHPTPDFSRRATATPDSYKYSPTAEALARYAEGPEGETEDSASLRRQYLAYGYGHGLDSVDSTPGQEMSAERLFYKVPKPSSTALGSVTGTPGLGVLEEYPVPAIPAHLVGAAGPAGTIGVEGLTQVGMAVTADSAITSPGAAKGTSMGMSRSASGTSALGVPEAQAAGMAVQASASSSALPYLSPRLGGADLPSSAYIASKPVEAGGDRSHSPDKARQGSYSHGQTRPMVRSSSSNSSRPGAMYDTASTASGHTSATAEGLIAVALEAGESIWDPKIYMLVAAPPPSPSSGLTAKLSDQEVYGQNKKRQTDAYFHPALKARREKDKLATFDELAFGKVGWREWLWPVPPSKPEGAGKKAWRRKDRTRTRREARKRTAEREREGRKARQDDDEEEEEEVVLPGRDWSKVKIDGYRPAPPPPTSGVARSGSFSSTVDSPLSPFTSDLANSASRLESTLNRSGSYSNQHSVNLAPGSALAAAAGMRRELRDTVASTVSRGSISSDVTDDTVRSAGSGGTGGTARRVPPPTPPPAGPLPPVPHGGVQTQQPTRPGSAAGHYAQSATVTAATNPLGARKRTGSFGAGSALKVGQAQGQVYARPVVKTAGGVLGQAGSAGGSGAGSQEDVVDIEKLTPAERRRRMRGNVAVMDLGMSCLSIQPGGTSGGGGA